MNFKSILLIILILLTSCKQIDTSNIDYKNKFILYSNTGFAIIYDDKLLQNNIVTNKIDDRSLIIFNNKLNVNTPVRITNLLNGKYIVAKVGINNKYPNFYNSVISKRISKEIEIDIEEPYVKIQSINSDSSFIANKAKTFEEEKNVATKVPIEEITIKNIGVSNDSNKNIKKESNNQILIKKGDFKYIIKFADLYFEKSAIDFKNRLINEYKLKDVNTKKISENSFRVYMGPYNSLSKIEKAFETINNSDFDNIEIVKLW